MRLDYAYSKIVKSKTMINDDHRILKCYNILLEIHQQVMPHSVLFKLIN